jgi:hypothetical protein
MSQVVLQAWFEGKSPGLVGFREPAVTAAGLLAGVSLPG